jgi:hypothetical protein
MTPIAKGFILGVAASTKRYTRVFANKLTSRSYNPQGTSDVQWTIEPGIDCCFIRPWLLGSAIEAFEVQRAGRARHDHLGNPIRGRRINLDPGSFLRLEDFRQTTIAVTGVNAQLWFP